MKFSRGITLAEVRSGKAFVLLDRHWRLLVSQKKRGDAQLFGSWCIVPKITIDAPWAFWH